jgi:hypothetical protein
MTRNTAWESTDGLMVESTLESGLLDNKMTPEFTSYPTVRSRRTDGRMERREHTSKSMLRRRRRT